MVGKFKDFSIGGGVVKMAPPLLSPASSKIPRGDILEKAFQHIMIFQGLIRLIKWYTRPLLLLYLYVYSPLNKMIYIVFSF
jgi:hypothetical protein